MEDQNRNPEQNRTDEMTDMQKKPSQGAGDVNQGNMGQKSGQPSGQQSGQAGNQGANQGSDQSKNRDQETDRDRKSA